MKIYILSLLAGMLAGGVYGLINVRSPAPPVIALVGLLGMLIGEQAATLGKRVARGEPISRVWFHKECVPKITGAPSTPDPSLSSNERRKSRAP
jgi:XapX domain-containing protein